MFSFIIPIGGSVSTVSSFLPGHTKKSKVKYAFDIAHSRQQWFQRHFTSLPQQELAQPWASYHLEVIRSDGHS